MRREEIMNGLIERGYHAEACESVKNGVIAEGIVIREDPMVNGTIAPVIYTSGMIQEAEKYGDSLDDVIEKVIGIYNRSKDMDFNISLMTNKFWVLSHIYIAIQKASDEKIIREECKNFSGLEKYLYLRELANDGDSYSMKVSRELLEDAGVDQKEAWKMAEKNTFAETTIRSMGQVMAETLGIPYDISIDAEMPIYVVSNKKNFRGASAILNEDRLEKLARANGLNKLIVIPSSVHEMLVVPYSDWMEVDEITGIVREVNETQVIPEERLTDQAYILTVA